MQEGLLLNDRETRHAIVNPSHINTTKPIRLGRDLL